MVSYWQVQLLLRTLPRWVELGSEFKARLPAFMSGVRLFYWQWNIGSDMYDKEGH